MVLRRFSILVSLTLAVCTTRIVAFAEHIADFVRQAIDVIASPFRPTLALEGWADISPKSGHALDRALQHDMRHEAGFSRRSAARHI